MIDEKKTEATPAAVDTGLHLSAMQAALGKVKEAILMMELVARTYALVHGGRHHVEDAGKFLYDAMNALTMGHGKAVQEIGDKAKKIAGH